MKLYFYKTTLFLLFLFSVANSFGQTCTVPTAERDALIALYNATDGANWTNTLANNQPWDINIPVCDWYGVSVVNGTVTGIDLRSNLLSGPIPATISNLSNLESVILYDNQLSGVIPSQLGSLTNLIGLNLSKNLLTGNIPIEIGNLTNLSSLHLGVNQLTGTIPTQLGNLTSLNVFYLYDNQLTGSIPTQLGNLVNVTDFRLYNNQLTGNIPTSLSALTNLSIFYLRNNQLTGSIPTEFSSLTKLTTVHFGNNQLTGNIPSWIYNLPTSSVVNIYLNDNQLSGTLPANITTNLGRLHLGNNQLTGTIPSTWSNLPNLSELHLMNNQLTGAIPMQVEDLTGLSSLYLYNNNLSGVIPSQLGNLTNLTHLLLYDNQLSGDIPSELSLISMVYFSFRNNNFIFSDFETEHLVYDDFLIYQYSPQAKVDQEETPTAVENSSYTFTTSLSSANNSYQWYKDGVAITGATSKDYTINSLALADAGVYHVVATNSIVTGLTLQRNNITLAVTADACGVPTSERDALMALYNATNGDNWTNTLANNQPWDINIPVCDWYGVTVQNGHVTELAVANNNLDGTIPTELGNLTNVKRLELNLNQLSGSITIELGNLNFLEYLNLDGNSLSGTIPTQLGNLSSLTYLNFDRNQLTGNIPIEMGSLSNLTDLRLYANQLSGNIPVELENLTSLETLLLANNQLTGSIPNQLGTLLNLEWLNLDGNQLVGNIPLELGSLINLTYLALGHNQLTDNIPSELGNLLNLKTLNLERNFLTGNIPESLNMLSSIETVLLDQNKLTGNILNTFKNSSNLQQIWIQENNFIFNDLENDHSDYISNLSFQYQYSPQTKVDQEETINVTEDNNITLTSNQLTSLNNSYQWYKDGVLIPGAISKDYVITNATATDAGVYHFLATNSIVTGLTLERNTITLNVFDESSLLPLTQYCYYNAQSTVSPPGGPTIPPPVPGSITYYDEYGNEQIIIDIMPDDGNVVVMSSSLPTIEFLVSCWSTNTFCTSDIEAPTVAHLTPSGPNILWYSSETDTTPLPLDFDLSDVAETGGVIYWWDDISDGDSTRTPVTVYVDENTPLGETYQEFSVGATVALLQATGANIQWYNLANGGTPLNSGEILIDGEVYYAEDSGVSSCRLAVEVFVGTIPPKGDGVQYVCPESTITNLVLETIPQGNIVLWYLTETGGSSVSTDTPLTNGTTYYASMVDVNNVESIERKAITSYVYTVKPPSLFSSTQTFYSNEEHTIGNLIAIGNNLQWYSFEGTPYGDSHELNDGETYYVQQQVGECISERVGVTVNILEDELPTIISCEKFKPQLGGRYVISGWVREQSVTFDPNNATIINFSDVSSLFVDLLNHLKDRLLSSDKFDLDIPPDVYIPESDDEIVNFDALVPYIVGLEAGESKLKVYKFTRIKDENDYGRTIGFQFALTNQENAPVFKYETPLIEVSSCNTCYHPQTNQINHPLLGRGTDILEFTSAQFNNGILDVSQSFTPADGLTVVAQNPVTNITPSILSETITYNDFVEDTNYQPPHYDSSLIELSYIGKENIDLSGETLTFSPQGAIIDGWQRVTGEFTIPADAKLLNINLKSISSDVNAYFDDIRVHPYDSNMKTFVYHPENQRLMSELDENNYATFYEYDLEGGLVRVKKETEKGIYTIQETRSGNIKTSN